MKNFLTYVVFFIAITSITLVIVLLISSCQKLEIERELKIETDSISAIKTNSAIARATIKDIGNGEVIPLD